MHAISPMCSILLRRPSLALFRVSTIYLLVRSSNSLTLSRSSSRIFMSMSTSTAGPVLKSQDKVRIVNYNVLSSHLASPDHFTKCDPEHLEASNRLPKVLRKLEYEMKNENNIPAIFCLQEVSQSWAGKLHTFFANKNYHLVTALYGKPFNNYMGIAIAFPIDKFEVIDVDIARLSDYREGGWPRLPEEEKDGAVKSTIKMSMKTIRKTINLLLLSPIKSVLQIPPPKESIDHWKLSENRQNVMLFCRLRSKGNKGEIGPRRVFCISNYHMPCAFYAPMVMNIHAEMIVKRTQRLALEDPFILAGDFNFMPDSPTYALVTTGALSKDDETYPAPKFGMEWSSTIEPMRSAYAESGNKEPDFTNFAQIREDDPFIGTLDYIFLSKHWKVDNVLKTIDRNEASGPYPNAKEPSDHIMIWSDLELKI